MELIEDKFLKTNIYIYIVVSIYLIGFGIHANGKR